MASDADAALLMRRAGFGARLDQLGPLRPPSRETIASQLVDAALRAVRPSRPTLLNGSEMEWPKVVRLRAWWYDQMSSASAPLVEKMTLFWHGHFCSGYSKPTTAENLWAQNDLFRRQGLGNYRTLVKAMAVQPAMLRFLDNMDNVKGSPNENFARELWELFLLGPGTYTEADVRTTARAWSGHGIALSNGRDSYVFDAAKHDVTPGSLWGVTRSWNGPDTIDATLDHPVKGPVAARWICRKLWDFFGYTNADASLIDGFAQELLRNRWELAPTLRSMLSHPEMFSSRSRQGRLRSPAEYVVAVARMIGAPATALVPDWFAGQMGQELLNPPDVAGWELNEGWISTGGFWGRASLADSATSILLADRAEERRFASLRIRERTESLTELAAYFGIVPDELSTATRSALLSYRNAQVAAEQRDREWGGFLLLDLVKLVLLSPEFQIG
jgi:uncharacterized protein (DUF1800 family)